jgi:CMP-N-acetylneuraminic acid synthetase
VNREIVAVIPVKENSDRVKSKNLRPFADTSLYELKLKQMAEVQGFSNVYISSESEKILDMAKKFGYKTHERDSKYSTSSIPMSDVYSNIASEIEGEYIAWVNVTNPLAPVEAYENAILEFQKLDLDKYDCLLSVFPVQDYIFYNNEPVNFKPFPWPRSQDLQGMSSMSFVVNILSRTNMVKWGSCVGEKPYLYELDPVDSMDIDFPEDFELAELIYKKRHGLS